MFKSWFIHNTVAHPVSEFCYWIGFVWSEARKFGDWLHDATIPAHEPGTGRG